MKNSVNEELNKMKYLLGYQRGMVMSEQALVSSVPAAATATAAAPATVSDVIKQIQTALNDKHGGKLVVDGKWGNNTQAAFDTAVKSKAAAPAAPTGTPAATTGTPAATTGTPAATTRTPATPIALAPKAPLPSLTAPTVPGVSNQTTTADPEAQSPDDIIGTEVAPQTNRDQRRDRQDMRRGQRRDRQDLRAQQRTQ